LHLALKIGDENLKATYPSLLFEYRQVLRGFKRFC